MGNQERHTVVLELSKDATGSVWWLFNGDMKGNPSGVRVNSFEDGKRVRRILSEIKRIGLDKSTGALVACKIDIGPKDMKYLRDTAEPFFKRDGGAPSERSVGLVELIEGIEKAEEIEVERKAKLRKEAKERGEEPEEKTEEE